MTDNNGKIVEEERQRARQPAPKAPGEGSPYHILAATSLADEQTRVLKHADTFAVFDHYGDIKAGGWASKVSTIKARAISLLCCWSWKEGGHFS